MDSEKNPSPMKVDLDESCTPPKEATIEPKDEEPTEKIASTGTANSNHEAAATAPPSSTTPSWDHSDRKLLILNIPKYSNGAEVQKMLKRWLVDRADLLECVEHVRKPHDKTFSIIKMTSIDMVQPFIDYLHEIKATTKKGDRIKCDRVKGKQGYDDDNGRDEGNNNNKRKSSGEEMDKRKKKRQRQPRKPLTEEEVKKALTPLYDIPYERQLTRKMRQIGTKSLRKLIKEVKHRFRELDKEARRNPKHCKVIQPYDWLDTRIAEHPIPMDRIVASPLEVEYRNKCELTFGYENTFVGPATPTTNGKPVESAKDTTADSDKKDESTHRFAELEIKRVPAAGFMAAGWSGGVNHPKVARNVPWEICALADLFNRFLQDFSELPPYSSVTHEGIWRQVSIRSSKRTKECMVVICHSPATGGAGNAESSTSYCSERLTLEKGELVRRLTAKELVIPDYYPKAEKETSSATTSAPESETNARTMTSLRVTSIFFQEYDGLSNPKPSHPVEHVYGKKFLEEKLLQCTFQISPGAFFQVNTEGAELLYRIVVEKIRETCPDPAKTILMDVCCGTGTIGLTCLKEGVVSRIVGVDISKPAIVDAKRNAERNGYTDAKVTKFIASKAEDVMEEELRRLRNNYSNFKIVAVVDPARDGLHMDVVRALRAMKRIDRLIYVSCNPTGSFVRDATALCVPPSKKFRGEPFYPARARPVDMFPWTDHCELVTVFERLSQWNPAKPKGDDSKESSSEKASRMPGAPGADAAWSTSKSNSETKGDHALNADAAASTLTGKVVDAKEDNEPTNEKKDIREEGDNKASATDTEDVP